MLNLAEVLWESIPVRLQRRLRELCDQPDALDYDVALNAAVLLPTPWFSDCTSYFS